MIRLLCFSLTVLAAASCKNESADVAAEIAYVATIHPVRAIVEPIIGDRGVVRVLIEPGESPHTHDTSPSDARAAQHARGTILVSEGFDGWAGRFAKENVIALFDLVPDSLRHSIFADPDPHFWTDPLTVAVIAPLIAESLCASDPAGCDAYRYNAETFVDSLGGLHTDVAALLASVKNRRVMISEPFFLYFLERYGFDLIGVIEPQPGVEPSPREVARLIRLARDSTVAAILVQEQLSQRISKLVSETTNVPLVTLDPLGGIPGRFGYIELIAYNAQTLALELQ